MTWLVLRPVRVQFLPDPPLDLEPGDDLTAPPWSRLPELLIAAGDVESSAPAELRDRVVTILAAQLERTGECCSESEAIDAARRGPAERGE